MITENAPPIFLFYMDETLSEAERKELLELNAKAKLEPAELERIDTLTNQYYDLRSTTPIPVPVVGELIGMIPEGYKQSMVKSIDMAGGVPVLKGNVNTATVTLKSSSNDFINAMMGIASWFFAKDDALPRVCFFSPEMVIIGGTLLNMTRANKADSTEQVLTLEMQKGDKSILGDNSNTQTPTNIPKTVEVVK
ncbi:hypothetical protein HUO09_05435 [Vibrio sp. Y2-5]|uniref:hypothetical protein n=1 Tax=Vibrio TaxID=662 RepID=UPI00142E13EA|nr:MULTISPECIES: hypothetical protein [Vibrio]MBD0785774.1 hypothetical protein [Vibrio sp. Y2-5]NIY91098.1 hypothetical protein [Vibrio diazotrophicus]